MGKLDEAIQLIDTNFPANWWVGFGFDKSREDFPELPQKITAFKQLLDNVEESFFDLLNISIIRGEYVEQRNYGELLAKLKVKIENLKPSITTPDDEVSELLFISGFIKGFIEPLKLAVNFYSEFYASVERKLKVSEKEYILKYHDEILNAIEEKKCDENSLKNLELLQSNITVAECDHFLSIEGNQLPVLIKITRKLSSSLNIKPYAPLIRLKANYLRNKLILRLRHERKPKQVYTVINGHERQVVASDMMDGSIFDEWLQYTNIHYELVDDWKEYIAVGYEPLKNKRLQDCSALELHRMIKYHKDVNKNFPSSVELIEAIREEFKRRRDENQSSNNIFNIYALSIGWNYAVNNEFSLSCEKGNETIEEAEKLYGDIMTIQSQSGIKNFFPQTKFLKFLLGRLKLLYNQKKALEVVSKCREIIDKCQSLYDKYEENVNWSKRNYNYVYQLPFEECCIQINDANTDRIFVFSSFLLPLPKDKYLKEFDENRNEVAQLEASVRVFENVETEISELETLKNEVEALRNNVKDREIRTMEILGIFTALISFVAASLPTFKVIDTPMEAALFMLALATSFSVFVFLLLVSFRGIEKLMKHKRIIITGFILACLLWLILILISFLNPFKSLNQPKSEIIESNTPTYVLRDTVYINNTVNNNITFPTPKKPTITQDTSSTVRTKKPPC